MRKITRRNFIKGSVASAASVGIVSQLATPVWSKVRGANEDIRIGVVGFRSKGADHINQFSKIPGVRVAAICDVDSEVITGQVKKFKQRNEKVDTYTDIRKLLENKNIDAISIATPNHWHSLITIWACQAGKDVYVEKPVSHNIFEGRKMVEAARKYNRIVQAGTHIRSDTSMPEIFEYLQQGNIGAIKVARGFCYKRRKSIGKATGIQPIPASVDYDLWTGPAPLTPLMRERLHYDWHWVWPTGNGDLGNQGVHEVDLCRWALGRNTLPKRVMSIGGRLGYNDDGTTANTQVAVFDYEPAPLIFEVRGLPLKKDSPAMSNYKNVRVGIVIECEGGYFAGASGGGWIYNDAGKKIKQFSGGGGGKHFSNFIDAVRSRNVSDLNCDILEGHISSALCHMANISHRLGQKTDPDKIKEAVSGNKYIADVFKRTKEHLFENWVDITKDKLTLGPWLEMDTDSERFIDNGQNDLARWANMIITRNYRNPFIVPENV